MSYFDELKKTKGKKKVSFAPKVKFDGEEGEGFIWLNMLLKYNLADAFKWRCKKCGHIHIPDRTDIKSDIVRAFAKPAEKSRIKGIIKPKKEEWRLEKKKPAKKKELF